LRFLADHPEEAARMGADARDVARRKYVWNAVVRRCLDAYADPVLRPAAGRRSP
jgi:hypothetical protein